MVERVWDRFLTEQDRKLASARPFRRIGFGRKPALLLVDLYWWVFGDKPEPLLESIKKWPASCGMAGWNALPHIKELLRAARELSLPIIHTANSYSSELGIDHWTERGREPLEKRSTEPASQSRIYEIVEELKPLPGEAIIRKSSPSAFWGTPLAGHLVSSGIDTLVVGGESTSGCVRATVVDGRTLGYRMIVVEECVFDRTESSHAINLFDMDQKYADVISLKETLNKLKSTRKDTALKITS